MTTADNLGHSDFESCDQNNQSLPSGSPVVPPVVLYDEALRADQNETISVVGVPGLAGTLRLLHQVLRPTSSQNDHMEGATILNDPGASDPRDTCFHQDITIETARLPARFQIQRLLGKGGFGAVYLATDSLLQRDVAIKLPHRIALENAELQERFLRESRALARLNHPSIVRVLDSGTLDGLSWQVTEFVDGPHLNKFCQQHGKILPPAMAARILLQLADAVQHAHDQGVLHRDIKPDNILIEKPNNQSVISHRDDLCIPRLTDFGLARLLDDETSISHAGLVIGTPKYMAPEQLKGQPDLQGPWTDIYSLGVVLYELLNGTIPFPEAKSLQARVAIADQPVRSFRHARKGISRDMETICLKCLSINPKDRYSSAGALRDDLLRVLDGRPTLARPLPYPEQFFRWAIRNRTLAAASFVVVTAVLIVLTQTIYSYHRSQIQNHQLTQTLSQLTTEKLRSDSLAVLADQNRIHAEQNAVKFRTLAWNSTVREALSALVPRRFSAVNGLLETLRRSQPENLHRTEWQLTAAELHRHFEIVFSFNYPLHEIRAIPGTRLLAVAGESSVVSLIDAGTHQVVRSLHTNIAKIHALAVSPDGQRIAVGGSTNADDVSLPLVYSMETGQLLQSFPPQETTIESLLFTSDGKYLACGCRYEPVRVFDLIEGTETQLQTRRRNHWLAESPDGKEILAHETNDSILAASPSGRTATRSLKLPEAIEFAARIGDSSLLACTSYRGTHIDLLNIDTGQICGRLLHSDNPFTSITVSHSHRMVFAGREDGSVAFWQLPPEWLLPPSSTDSSASHEVPEVRESEIVQVDDQPVRSMVVADDSLYCSTDSGRLVVFRFPLQVQDVPVRVEKNIPWRSAAINAGNGDVFIGEAQGEISVLKRDEMSPTKRSVFSVSRSIKEEMNGQIVHDDYPIDGITTSPDGDLVAWANWTQQIQATRLTTGDTVQLAPVTAVHNGGIDCLCFSHDGQYVAWSGSEKQVALRRVDGLSEVQTASLDSYGNAVCFSPDGTLLACGCHTGELLIFDCSTMTAKTILRDCSGCTAICWDVARESLLLGFRNGTVQIRSLNGSCQTRNAMHRIDVRSIVLSPDKQLAVSVDQSGQTALWNPDTGEFLGMLFQPNLSDAGMVSMPPAIAFIGTEELMLAYDDGVEGPQIIRWRLGQQRKDRERLSRLPP